MTTRSAADLKPGDPFFYRAVPRTDAFVVEVARVQRLRTPGAVRIWAYSPQSPRSRVSPFNAGIFHPGETVQVP